MAFSPLDIKSSSSYTYIFSPRNCESQTITYKENLLSNTHRRHHKGEHATILWCIIKWVLRFASFLYKKMCQILEYLVKQAKKKPKQVSIDLIFEVKTFFFFCSFFSRHSLCTSMTSKLWQKHEQWLHEYCLNVKPSPWSV